MSSADAQAEERMCVLPNGGKLVIAAFVGGAPWALPLIPTKAATIEGSYVGELHEYASSWSSPAPARSPAFPSHRADSRRRAPRSRIYARASSLAAPCSRRRASGASLVGRSTKAGRNSLSTSPSRETPVELGVVYLASLDMVAVHGRRSRTYYIFRSGALPGTRPGNPIGSPRGGIRSVVSVMARGPRGGPVCRCRPRPAYATCPSLGRDSDSGALDCTR
ncbi:MAG: putative NAD-dependent alcohol dehydrogenase [Microvirga sp.]|jgi:hypothetical protein|nr:putative NAD-dependent alcohol dehydrogenase [Thermomicrobiales bacterium]MDF2974044.1 putative NAD-dependent alcohol dehydrogenase [Microvirga sp.]